MTWTLHLTQQDLALIATGGGTGAWLLTRSTQYLDVLVVAAPVARGERIEAADLNSDGLIKLGAGRKKIVLVRPVG